MILPKVMDFWFQTKATSVRDAIDEFAKAVEIQDRLDYKEIE